MGLAEITQTKGWKNFMAKLYGIGAAVVILGALFKIQHWPGAGVMLTIGLLVEALIFFVSAFEPLHEELDWTLVYPELAGLAETDEIDAHKPKKVNSAASTDALAKFDEMLQKAGGENMFSRLGEGLQNLTQKTGQLADISQATVATKEYADSMKKASSNVGQLSASVNELSDAYHKSSEQVTKSNGELAGAYKKLADSMNVKVDFNTVTEGNKSYNEQISKLNKNLQALNALVEIQMQGGNLESMLKDLTGAVEESRKYKEEISKMTKRLDALNTVYGNMLAAMNVKA